MAQIGCCPMEAAAVQACAQTNMCADQACVAANCMREFGAFQTCFNTAQQSQAACQDMLGGCFGSFPPACM
jgi:hypothetical protein